MFISKRPLDSTCQGGHPRVLHGQPFLAPAPTDLSRPNNAVHIWRQWRRRSQRATPRRLAWPSVLRVYPVGLSLGRAGRVGNTQASVARVARRTRTQHSPLPTQVFLLETRNPRR